MEDPDFWHDKWESGKIGFHQNNYHSLLVKYWPDLNLDKSAGVLVPLCGKSSDMIWLAQQGHNAIGVELSAIAAKDFFAENNLKCDISSTGKFQKYQSESITILVGDFFDLTQADIPNVKAVYDRAALIALPDEMRARYIEHLRSILAKDTQILLITLAYDQAGMTGPPFSVPPDSVENAYKSWCRTDLIDSAPPEDFRGITAFESVFRLQVR